MYKFAVLAALSLASATPALAGNIWEIDSQHSTAAFSIKHMMVSNVHGQIGGVKGTVEYDGKNINTIKVDAELNPDTINTNEPDRDKHLKSPDFFDTTKFPKINFKSKKSIASGKGTFTLIGDLTMHGVTKEVKLNVVGPTPAIKDKNGTAKIGATASTVINRKDFGITYNKALDNGGLALGETVPLTIELEMANKG